MTANRYMSGRTGIYIHIPFCVKKCSYCAFLSFRAETSPRREYADALVSEIKLRAKEFEGREIDTVYVGGGTPSVLDLSQLRDIMHAVKSSFNIKPGAEITIEANPGTLGQKDGVSRAKLKAYRYMGFNRLSMGVQSMDNDRLQLLGRIHTAENVIRDFCLARELGFDNINLDLIFSVPGETSQDALSDAKKLIDLGPEHISCYSLQLEEGTAFAGAVERGELTEVPDKEDRETYHMLCALMAEAGYEHYEISNFARMSDGAKGLSFDEEGPGSPLRSQHNSLYWDMSDYIGLGLGASGFTGGARYKNISDIDEYIKAMKNGGLSDICAERHVNSSFDSISEAVFTGLRRRGGISYDEAVSAYAKAGGSADETGSREVFMKVFSNVFDDPAGEAACYAERGLLLMDERGLRLSEQGIDISNSIMSLFV